MRIETTKPCPFAGLGNEICTKEHDESGDD
jgi:hypothetical protein